MSLGDPARAVRRRLARTSLVQWWLDEEAPDGRELSSFAFLATLIVLALMVLEVWRHGHTRTAGVALILQLAAVVVGVPLLIRRLLPQARAQRLDGRWRILVANTLRWPLRHRRVTRSLALGLFLAGTLVAVGAKAPHPAALAFVVALLIFGYGWLGFLLPRRYTARIDPSSGVVTGYVAVARHPRARVIAGAMAVVLFFFAYLIQFLALYAIPPW